MSTCHRVLRAMSGAVWAIEPQKLDRIVAFVETLANGARPPEEAIAALQTQARPRHAGAGGRAVAVIPFHGTVFHRANQVDRVSAPGGISIQELRAMFRQALADPQVGSILLEVDSPGGHAAGVQEFADEIFAARGRKRIVALADTMAASAAYWIASAAEELHVTPSGSVGSIGAFAIHREQSARDETEGVRYTYISAGKYKTEGNPHEPLSDEARSWAQEQVDAVFAAMTAGIARYRGMTRAAVSREFGEGRLIMARDAKARGMTDGIATFDQVIARLQSGRGRAAGSAVAGPVTENTPSDTETEPEPEAEPDAGALSRIDAAFEASAPSETDTETDPEPDPSIAPEANARPNTLPDPAAHLALMRKRLRLRRR